MILLNEDNNKIYAQKCSKPSYKNIRGRTWDTGHIVIDGHKVCADLDTTWGEYIYFQWYDDNGYLQWYKLKMISDSIDDLKRGYSYDVDPFAINPVKLTTK